MNQYNPNIHHRRSIRLKGFDYSRAGLYFITICTQNRKILFGNIENGEMKLNDYGRIVEEEWQKTTEIRKNIALHEYIVMPNHFHAIVEITYPIAAAEQPVAQTEFKSPSQNIGAIIRGFKGAGTKRIKEFYSLRKISTGELQFAPTISLSLSDKIWQRNYYEHIIRDEQSHQRISEYIINNPAKWEEDKFNTI